MRGAIPPSRTPGEKRLAGNALVIGSGGSYALAAARAMVKHGQGLTARDIFEDGLSFVTDICTYTDHSRTILELNEE